MNKLLASAGSSLVALGLAGFVKPLTMPDDDNPAPPHSPKSAAPAADPSSASADKKPERDPADELRRAYALLKRLRSQRDSGAAEGRPREWTDRATHLYRVGVASFQNGDLPQARAYAAAAHQLARAVELARDATLSEVTDPDLPAPPGAVAVVVHLRSTTDTPAELPPPLPKDDEKTKTKREVIKRRAYLMIPETRRTYVTVSPDQTGEPKAPASDERVAEEIKRLQEKLRRLIDERAAVNDLPERTRHELQETISELQRIVADVSRSEAAIKARRELKTAYEKIQQARKQHPGEGAEFYLDAASDLYNAARRDAEAGRYERASELARAAVSLTLVPENLAQLPGRPPQPPEPRSGRVERKTIIRRRVEKKDPNQAEGKNDGDAESKSTTEKSAPQPKVELRYRIVRPGKQGKEQIEEEELQIEPNPAGAARTIVGIGVALRPEKEGIEVAKIIPDGPAARDGRLKVGDRIVGIETAGGEKVEFGDKPLGEISWLIRGPKGTKLRLIVIPKGSTEREVYELTRDTLKLPAPKAGARDGDGDGDDDSHESSGKQPNEVGKTAPRDRDDTDLPPPLFD